MLRLLARSADAFPLWILAAALIALTQPGLFTWFRGGWIVWTLAVIMLGMGLTLVPDDFRRIGRMPRPVALGFLAQYLIMPPLGWTIAQALRLDPPLAVGLVLVACCPGGTASNIVTYLARADVALSVVMTTCSTFAAVLMTPLLTSLLAGTWVEVDAFGLFLNTVQVVLLPVLLGVALRGLAPRVVERVLPVAPLVSVIGVTLIVGSIVGANAASIRQGAAPLLLAVFLLHAGGFGLGWLAARALGQSAAVCRTVSIEVGMQNSGLGVVLARQNFADPLTAVPCAISSVFHSLIGSLCAGVWRWCDGRKPASPPRHAVNG